MPNDWADRLAGARMQVDQQFNDRVRNSQFSNQEWGLIMTAVEFEIENPGRPGEAELVANTQNVPQIIPELDKVSQGMGAQPGGGSQRSGGGGGLFSRITGFLTGGESGGGGADEEKLTAATTLVDEYTAELQSHLEDQGRWDGICESAARS